MEMQNRPYSIYFNDHYWSASGGESEKSFVFLQGNNLAERFASASSFTIAELGFGTGLNFRLALHLWHQAAPKQSSLTYIGYEQHPFTPEQLSIFHPILPQHCVKAFTSGWNIRRHNGVTLQLFIGSAVVGISSQPVKANAWFLDGFTPSKNPEMWSSELLRNVANQTMPYGTFSTYTAARSVKDALTAAGFQWQRKKGHPPKQHMLVGSLI